MKEALRHLSKKITKARIVTDSLSLVQRVSNIGNRKQWSSWAEKEVFETLVELRDSMMDPLEKVWCSSHCDVDGSETAAGACQLPQARVEVLFQSGNTVIKRKPKRTSLPDHDTAAMYIDNDGAYKYPREKKPPPRTNENLQIKKWLSPAAKRLESQNGTSGRSKQGLPTLQICKKGDT